MNRVMQLVGRALVEIFTGSPPWLFLFVAVFLNLLASSLFAIWVQFFGGAWPSLLLALVLSVLGLVGCIVRVVQKRDYLRAMFQRIVRGRVETDERHEVFERFPRRGIIFTVSPHFAEPSGVPHWVFGQLERMGRKPEYVGFLGSPQTDKAGVVDKLTQSLGLVPDRVTSQSWDPYRCDRDEGAIKTKLAIDWMLKKGLRKKDVVIDVTGGMVAMSIFAMMAAEECQVDTQCIVSDYDLATNRVVPGTQRPILVTHYP